MSWGGLVGAGLAGLTRLARLGWLVGMTWLVGYLNQHLNVLEMALKTFNFVQGLSRTPLLLFLDISPTYLKTKHFVKTNNIEIENLKISKIDPGKLEVASFRTAATVCA